MSWFGRKGCADGVHKFEARYDQHMPSDLRAEGIPYTALEFLLTKRYVQDVCIHCGKTIKRDSQ